MKSILIKNGNAIICGKVAKRDILIVGSKISDVDFSGEVPKDAEVIDGTDKYVSPGFVDIHLHGGGGYDFMDATKEAFKKISDIHLMNGTTTMLPTTVTAPISDIIKVIKTYKECIDDCPNFYGIHLEGPYISKQQKGAHKAELIHNPCKEETELLIKEGKSVIKRITAAPELCGMDRFVRAMKDYGVLFSIGHSDATSDIALGAMEKGFSHVTHLYSATPTIRKINEVIKAGVMEAAYLNEDVSVELIGDSKHVAVDALKLAVKVKGIDKVALVTDALRCAGECVKESYLGEKIPKNRIIIEDGVAKLPDRSSFAGSIATSSMLLEKGVNHYGLSVEDVVTMLTKTPARIIGAKNKGELAAGFDADIVIFDKNYAVKEVILAGKLVKGEKRYV